MHVMTGNKKPPQICVPGGDEVFVHAGDIVQECGSGRRPSLREHIVDVDVWGALVDY